MVLADTEGNALMTDAQRAEREKLLAKYMKKNEKKIVTWMKKNPGLKPPIFFDIEKNAFYWGEPDRQLKKQFNKEKRRLKNEVTNNIIDGVQSKLFGSPDTNTKSQPIIDGKVYNASDFQRLKEKTRSQIIRSPSSGETREETLQGREEDSD